MVERSCGKSACCLPALSRLPCSAKPKTVTLTLLDDLSSRLPSGTAFTERDEAGKIYHGPVVTHPARRFLRRGSLIMAFDESVVPVTRDNEGVFRAKARCGCSSSAPRW